MGALLLLAGCAQEPPAEKLIPAAPPAFSEAQALDVYRHYAKTVDEAWENKSLDLFGQVTAGPALDIARGRILAHRVNRTKPKSWPDAASFKEPQIVVPAGTAPGRGWFLVDQEPDAKGDRRGLLFAETSGAWKNVLDLKLKKGMRLIGGAAAAPPLDVMQGHMDLLNALGSHRPAPKTRLASGKWTTEEGRAVWRESIEPVKDDFPGEAEFRSVGPGFAVQDSDGRTALWYALSQDLNYKDSRSGNNSMYFEKEDGGGGCLSIVKARYYQRSHCRSVITILAESASPTGQVKIVNAEYAPVAASGS